MGWHPLYRRLVQMRSPTTFNLKHLASFLLDETPTWYTMFRRENLILPDSPVIGPNDERGKRNCPLKARGKVPITEVAMSVNNIHPTSTPQTTSAASPAASVDKRAALQMMLLKKSLEAQQEQSVEVARQLEGKGNIIDIRV